MKKYLKLMLVIAFGLVIAACANENDGPAADEPAENDAQTEVRVALIAHSPDSIVDDSSFNQGAWNGIVRFLETNNLPTNDQSIAHFFVPHEASDEARIDLFEDAINAGYNVLVLPGFHHETAIYEAQDIFPDTYFILLDAVPTNVDTRENRIEDNVAAVLYAEEQAGFLAGYAAVMEGHRSLGFMGGIAVPPVVRFGHGFVQGAEFAAEALELEAGEVTVNYMYVGGFAPTAEITTTAASWFASGVEVIFTAAGGAGASVFAAAEDNNGLVIGVDVDQYHLSDTIITSAMKGLDVSVYNLLTDIMNGEFAGGDVARFDASLNGVGLAMTTARLNNFTSDQLDAIFARIANGDVTVDDGITPESFPQTDLVSVTQL